MYQALYRKYRPRTFDDVVGQAHITETLRRQVESGRLSHAYLFTGTRGTGKTTCAKILSRAVNCLHPVNGNPCNECEACRGIENGSILDVLELDAASNNGVDQVRALRDEAVYTPAAVRKRVYIVDEVHMLSTAAFNALLKILEEPPAHLMFILATTELHKVPATIRSRCQQFSFKRLLPTDIAARLMQIAGYEGLDLTGEGAELLSRLADGALRDGLSLLDQCITPGRPIGEEEVLSALGLAGNLETAELLGLVAEHRSGDALETLRRLYNAGKDVGSLLGELSSLTRDLLVRRMAPRGGASLMTGGFDERAMRALGEKLSTPRLMQLLTLFQSAGASLALSPNRRTDAELCLLRACDETLDESASGISARLARLEALAAGAQFTAPVSPAAAAPEAARPEKSAPAADLPPWEEVPPPEEPGERIVSAPEPPAPAKRPPEQRRPARPEHAPASGAPTGASWAAVATSLRGAVAPSVWPFLNDPTKVQGRAECGTLKLYAANDFVRGMIGKPEILETVRRAAESRFGTLERTEVVVGSAPPESPSPESAPQGKFDDALDELAAFSGLDSFTVIDN